MLRASLLFSALVFGGALFAQVEEREEARTDGFVLGILTTGERAGELSEEERSELWAGHFENIGRLTETGELLLAGPVGEPLPGPDWRGVYVFDVADVSAARRLAEEDPAVAGGLFELELRPFESRGPWRRMPVIERARKAQGGAKARAYVLARAAQPEMARELEKQLVASGDALLHGEVAGDELWLWLNATDVEAAREWIPEDAPGEWHLAVFYSTDSLEEGPRAWASTFRPRRVEKGYLGMGYWTLQLDFFDRALLGTEEFDGQQLVEIAEHLAEWLDNDEDGLIDDPAIRAYRAPIAFLPGEGQPTFGDGGCRAEFLVQWDPEKARVRRSLAWLEELIGWPPMVPATAFYFLHRWAHHLELLDHIEELDRDANWNLLRKAMFNGAWDDHFRGALTLEDPGPSAFDGIEIVFPRRLPDGRYRR